MFGDLFGYEYERILKLTKDKLKEKNNNIILKKAYDDIQKKYDEIQTIIQQTFEVDTIIKKEDPVTIKWTIEDVITTVKELYYYRQGTAGGFMTKLFDLIGKADPWNKRRLSYAFPVVLYVYNLWYNCESEEEFFKNYNII